MTAKQYLKQLEKIRWKIKRLQKQIKEISEDRSYIRGMDYSSVRVQSSSSGTSAPMLQAEILTDLEAELRSDLERYHKMERRIIGQIEQLPDHRHREILSMRYVDGLSLRRIADEMGYSYDWAKHMHGYALVKFEKVIKN